ncbi:MAG: phosphatase PAP2 family protein [Candidatus Aenigmarchaeota archaeon]|nr:phosphatase PAP2 family protein [Candidatus Aenigmarchaeota archaeon]
MDNFRKLGLLLIVVLVFAGGYSLAQYLAPQGVVVNTVLDDYIPFVDFFVVFYILYYPMLLIPVALYWNDPRYRKMLLCFLAVILVSVIIYIGFQTQVVRPDIEPSDVFSELVLWFYSNDKAVNALPSLHVSLSFLAAAFVWRKSRRLGLAVALLALLVILSTVFIKQHAVLDVVAGLALAAAVYWLWVKRVFKPSGKK